MMPVLPIFKDRQKHSKKTTDQYSHLKKILNKTGKFNPAIYKKMISQ